MFMLQHVLKLILVFLAVNHFWTTSKWNSVNAVSPKTMEEKSDEELSEPKPDYPEVNYQVYIYETSHDTNHPKDPISCSGVVLNNTYVLASAMCTFKHKDIANEYSKFVPADIDDLKIKPANVDLRTSIAATLRIQRSLFPDNFDPNDQYNGYDIAVIQLAEWYSFGLVSGSLGNSEHWGHDRGVRPIRIRDSIMTKDEPCYVSGWNWETKDLIDLKTKAHVLTETECKNEVRYYMGTLCVSYNETDKCINTPGSPLVCYGDDGARLYGLYSWGHECSLKWANYPSLFTDVYHYKKYILYAYDNRPAEAHIAPANLTEFSYHVTLYSTIDVNGIFCSGSIFNDTHVITAARCLFLHDGYQISQKNFEIRHNQTKFPVKRFHIHPNFDPKDANRTSDIALIEKFKLADTLWYTTVETINNTACKAHYNITNTEKFTGFVCAIHDFWDCIGDPGSPLVYHEDGRSYLVGILSWASNYSTSPIVYTNIYHYRDWLRPKPQCLLTGNDVKNSLFQYQVSLTFDDDRKPFCSGVILNDSFLITAAHCMFSNETYEKIDKDIVQVLSGDIKLTRMSSHKVENYWRHEKFDTKNLQSGYDIALIKIAGTFKLNKPRKEDIIRIHITDGIYSKLSKCLVSGWRLEQQESLFLKYIEVDFVDESKCQSWYPNMNLKRTSCIASQYTNEYVGFKDGQLIGESENGTLKLAGIASIVHNCSSLSNHADIYTNVFQFRDWILYSIDGRVVDTTQQPTGKEAAQNTFKYQVSIALRDGAPFCSGSIINKTSMVTAAKCLYTLKNDKIKPKELTISAGHSNLNSTCRDTFSVGSYQIYPDYDPNDSDYDIALININDKFGFSRSECTAKIDLIDKTVNDPIQCIVSGWGLNRNASDYRDTLMYTTVKTIGKTECDKLYGDRYRYGTICTISEAGRNCLIDSGSPLTCEAEDGRTKLVGIYSWGPKCGPHSSPDVYTDVLYYRDWILYSSHLDDQANALVNYNYLLLILTIIIFIF